MRICNRCHVEKPLEAFYSDRSRRGGRQAMCKDCQDTHRRAKRASSPVLYLGEKLVRYWPGKTYLEVVTIYNKMLSDQGEVCRICLSPDPKHRLSVDHDHKTGKVRGLLCKGCNAALGSFKESYENLERAINYLKEAA